MPLSKPRLLAYLKHDHDAIPAVRMMRLSKDEIGQRADAMAQEIRAFPGRSELVGWRVRDRRWGCAHRPPCPRACWRWLSEGVTAHALAARLRAADPPVLARVAEGRLLLDLRTVFPEQDKALSQALFQVATK